MGSSPLHRQDSILRRAASVPVEVHLRRMKVREALDVLERYLNDAAVSGLPWVRVIHGKGSGTLRRAVVDYLSAHPLVTKYYPASPAEGGGGVTVAELG